MNYECKECEKRWLNPINGLIKKFPNVYHFCNGDINKFVLLLRKGVYPYEYMDSWKRFDEILLPDKKAFYSKLYLTPGAGNMQTWSSMYVHFDFGSRLGSLKGTKKS